MSEQLATYRSIGSILDTARDWKKESDGTLVKDETVEMSVLGGRPLTVMDAASGVDVLTGMFPSEKMKPIIAGLAQMVIEDGWTKERFEYAVNRMKRHPYPTFTAGQFLEIDKKITFGKTTEALRRKLRFEIDNKDIVMVRIRDNEKGMKRAYAYKDEAEEYMKDQIVAYWDISTNWWKFTGVTIEDSSISSRANEFKMVLFEYCNYPPRFSGEYPVEVVKDFFEAYSKVVPPGDKMKFEAIVGFDIESFLSRFNSLYKENFKIK